MAGYLLRSKENSDRTQIGEILNLHWGSTKIVSRGIIHDAAELSGFIAHDNGQIVGLLTYNIAENNCEIVTLNSLRENIGIGGALISLVLQVAKENGNKRLWLITTNDNLSAIRFYQKRGFQIAAIHIDAIKKSRQLKPEIPLLGNFDIPIRDEIEMEILI
jgi:N-acetylglutamate synthase-like GNAT family acetyltransferase